MRSSPALYPAVEILHILGFVVLVGSILALDVRVLGLGRAIPIQPMAQLLLPMSRFGFLLAIGMGFFLFFAHSAPLVRATPLPTPPPLFSTHAAHIPISPARPRRQIF